MARLFAPFRARRRVALLLGLLLVLAALGVWAAQRHFQIETQHTEAQQALHDCDFEAAKAHFLTYLSSRPQDAEAHFLLAQACRRARFPDFAQAQEHLTQAQRLGWPKADASLESLMLTFQEHPSDVVEKLFGDYVHARKPGSPLVLEALLRGDLHANHQSDALRWLNLWVEQYPDDWYAHLWRGAFFEYQNDPALAIPDFQQVLAHRPDDEEVRYRVGLMEVQSGYNYEEALGYLEPYCRQHADDPDALSALAECQRALGQGKEARALLEKVLAAHPRHFEATMNLTLLALDDGNYDEALRWLRRLEPLAYESHYEEMLQRLEHLQPVANNRNVPDQLRALFYLLAKVLHRTGDHAEAEQYERRLTQLKEDSQELTRLKEEQTQFPADVDRMYRIGRVYLRLGMKEDGIYWLRRVLREQPDHKPAQEELEKQAAKKGNPPSSPEAGKTGG